MASSPSATGGHNEKAQITDPASEVDEEAERSVDYYDEDGNLEIISSDNVVFKIHAYHLQAASKVFADMIIVSGPNPGKPIELTDHEYENEATLTAVFDVVIDGRDINGVLDSLVGSTVAFLRKYEFVRQLEICRLQLRSQLRYKSSAWSVFVRAAHLEDHQVCADAIASIEIWGKPKPGGPEVFGQSLAGNIFDPRNASKAQLELLPFDSLWALMRASLKFGQSEDRLFKKSAQKVGEEYARLMRLQKVIASDSAEEEYDDE